MLRGAPNALELHQVTPADPAWFIDVTTAQLAQELLRRSSTAVIAMVPVNTPHAHSMIFITDDVPNARSLAQNTTHKLNEVVRVIDAG